MRGRVCGIFYTLCVGPPPPLIPTCICRMAHTCARVYNRSFRAIKNTAVRVPQATLWQAWQAAFAGKQFYNGPLSPGQGARAGEGEEGGHKPNALNYTGGGHAPKAFNLLGVPP